MSSITSNENRLIEELYLALQLMLALFWLNLVFPIMGKTDQTSKTSFTIVFVIYVVVKIGYYAKSVILENRELSTCPSRLLTFLDGFFMFWVIYLEWMRGFNLLSLFYVYVLIQGIRYQGKKPWIFAIFPAAVHIGIIMLKTNASLIHLEHIIEVALYFVIVVFIDIPFRRIHSLNMEKQHYLEELEEKNEVLEKMATTDYLTALSNHQSFYTYLDELKLHAIRRNFPISLILMDIDNFKLINDTYGHLTGDQILKDLASIITSSIRSTDFAARYGGEEFAVILPNTDIDVAVALSERIREKVEEHKFAIGNDIIRVTISLGADTYKPESSCKCLYEFINNVDMLLYKAKHSGKNQVQYAS